jgi:hypothetical protein
VPLESAPGSRREAVAAGRRLVDLRHPHLVPVLGVQEVEDGLAVISARVRDAVSLTRLLAVRGHLDPGEAVTIGLPVAQALAAAHAMGTGHGALTTADILLEPNGRPLLSGIGIGAMGGLVSDVPDPVIGVDVYELADLLLDLMRQSTRPDAAAVAVAVSSAMLPDPRDRPSAGQLASNLAHSAQPVPVRMVPPPRPSGAGAPERAGEAVPPRRQPSGGPATEGTSITAAPGPPATRDGPDDIVVVADPTAPRGGAPPPGVVTTTDAPALVERTVLPPAPRQPPPTGRPRPARPAERRPTPPPGTSPPAGRSDRPRPSGPTAANDPPAAVAAPVKGLNPEAARQAAPSERRVASATGLRQGSRDARSGARHGRRGPLLLVGFVGLVVIVVAAALLSTRAGGNRSAATPRATSASPAAPDWSKVLAGLEEARAQAFERADPAALANVYLPGTAIAVADQEVLSQVMDRGAHVSALPMRILSLRVESVSATQVVLRVQEQLGAYDYLDTQGKVLYHQDASPPRTDDVTLVHTVAGWRILNRQPVS